MFNSDFDVDDAILMDEYEGLHKAYAKQSYTWFYKNIIC